MQKRAKSKKAHRHVITLSMSTGPQVSMALITKKVFHWITTEPLIFSLQLLNYFRLNKVWDIHRELHELN